MVAELAPGVVREKLTTRPNEVMLLDVREPSERDFAQISPSLHIPMAELPRRLDELPRDRELIVYCHSGQRSALVAGFLESRGFPKVSNLSGGIDAWSVEVDPTVPRYG